MAHSCYRKSEVDLGITLVVFFISFFPLFSTILKNCASAHEIPGTQENNNKEEKVVPPDVAPERPGSTPEYANRVYRELQVSFR